MKLELKNLAPYLPYGLKFQHPVLIWEGNPPEPSHDEIGESEMTAFTINDVLKGGMPILRPLSDLTKEIEQNGERFVPIKKIVDSFAEDDDGIESNINGNACTWQTFSGDYGDYVNNHSYEICHFTREHTNEPVIFANTFDEDNEFNQEPTSSMRMIDYETHLLLINWHFDVFGLIDKGLAIDINTI